MPFKNYEDKIKYNNIHNPDRVHHYRYGKSLRVWLSGIKKRLYVCELCAEVGKTEFHEYTSNPKEVIELCHECHDFIRLNKFDENKLFL